MSRDKARTEIYIEVYRLRDSWDIRLEGCNFKVEAETLSKALDKILTTPNIDPRIKGKVGQRHNHCRLSLSCDYPAICKFWEKEEGGSDLYSCKHMSYGRCSSPHAVVDCLQNSGFPDIHLSKRE